jgi:hypothetical protein
VYFHTGASVVQSLTSEIISNAEGASASVTENQTSNNHELLLSDGGTYYNGSTDSLSSIDTAGSIAFANSQTFVPNFVSGETAILASDENWHTITFGSQTASSLGGSGFAIASPGSATASNDSLMCATGNRSSHSMSFMYFIQQNIDPLR